MRVNPDTQVSYAADVRKTIMGDYSTLAMLDLAFGENTASSWLVTLLANLNKFAGSKNMDDPQTKSLAILLAFEYRDMKYSMVQLFFYRFKCGDFGKFYGKVDPMVITCAFKDFAEECKQKRRQYMDEEYEARHTEEQHRWEVLSQRWSSCRDELVRRCADASGKQLFGSLELYAYDGSQDLMTLQVSHEGYEQIENKFLSLFSEVVRRHFPTVKVQYSIYPVRPAAQEGGDQKKAVTKHADYVRDVCHSARRIIDNELGVDKDVLESMRYAFKLRYKYFPEDYLQAHPTSVESKDQ